MTEEKTNYITEVEEALGLLGRGYNNDPIPPNEFVSTISGFTLAPDALINEFGFVTALVWGVTWRFCQMSDGVCRAGLEKIAARLGMSERTIIRHLDLLCKEGYLKDTTPDLKNKPHIYADTGKIRVQMSLSARVTESQRAMTESQRQGDRESVEESIKRHTKESTATRARPNIFELYESNIGALTPMISDTLTDAEKEFNPQWIEDAIRVAVENNKRNWKYCLAILKRWKEEGKDDGKREPKITRKYGTPAVDALNAYGEANGWN